MKKRVLSVILAGAMAFSLAACGNSGAATEEAATSSDAAEEETTADTATDEDLPFDVNNLGDPVTLTVSCGFAESEQGSITLTYCMDMIEDLSGGNITFDRYMGGSISTPLEDGNNIATGATDFGSMLEATMTEKLITWQYAGNGPSVDETMGLCDEIYFNNEETAAITSTEAEAAGLKVLAGQITGHNCIVTRELITSYSELAGLTMGTEIGGETWKLYGMSPTTIAVTDEYESLSRGVVDATSASLTAVASNKWVEVAPYVLVSDATRVSFWLCMNIDKWNSLSADQQALIQYACDKTSEYSMTFTDEFEAEAIAEMEAAGATITWASEEDVAYDNELKYLQDYNVYSAIAEEQGKLDEFNKVADAALAYFGYSLDELNEKYGDLFN
ncbi:MAG: TRAP transporter substrate-binding protein DctP [Eubacterium sp.]|nr:TRAP transporter substrate-binding protein DctP [Eubacterium sp.]